MKRMTPDTNKKYAKLHKDGGSVQGTQLAKEPVSRQHTMPKPVKPARYEHATWEHVPQNIQKIIEDIRSLRKGIYIHGAVGTGKTHIVYGVQQKLYDMGISSRVHNTTELIFDLKQDINRDPIEKKNWESRLIEYKGVLILDDIGSERITDYVAEVFYLIINHRYNEMKPTIFTSNLKVGELAQRIGDRTASRIVEMCEVVQLGGNDRRIQAKVKS